MKINEVEAAVGITKKNIRFYEEEGLLRPRRDAGNGYRDYDDADVARLRRIKLLRRLDVPMAEIREMLGGQVSLAEGMLRHAQALEARRSDLAQALEVTRGLGARGGALEALDAADALRELERREEQGATFVNVQKVDRRGQRYQGAAVGAALFIAIMVAAILIILWACWADPQNRPPLPLILLLTGIPAACIVCVLVVLFQRIAEIRKGEEDAYRDY